MLQENVTLHPHKNKDKDDGKDNNTTRLSAHYNHTKDRGVARIIIYYLLQHLKTRRKHWPMLREWVIANHGMVKGGAHNFLPKTFFWGILYMSICILYAC